MGTMRRLLLLLLLATLGGCGPVGVGFVATDIASVAVLGRGVGDIGVSAVTGRDCSVVRLDTGKTYCAPRIDTPPPQPFCTRSLARVDCWADPYLVPRGQRDVTDTPPPTEDQLRYRSARWPKALFF